MLLLCSQMSILSLSRVTTLKSTMVKNSGTGPTSKHFQSCVVNLENASSCADQQIRPEMRTPRNTNSPEYFVFVTAPIYKRGTDLQMRRRMQ